MAATRHMLPHEILLNILGHLDGDIKTIRSLRLACKLFQSLLTENEPRIAYKIAQRHKAGPIRFLLEARAPTYRPSFLWLSDAYTRGHSIELLVNALENAGLYKDQSIFGTHFSVHGRPLVLQDHADVHRYVLTMLLAAELCALKSSTSQRLIWAAVGPQWTAGFVLLSRDLIRYLVKILFLCIEGHTAVTWGPSDEPTGFFPTTKQADRLVNYLHSGLLLSGARGIVEVLSSVYDTYDQFVAVARARLYRQYLSIHGEKDVWPHQLLPESQWLWRSFQQTQRLERQNSNNTDASYKDFAGANDLDDWKLDVYDDESWARFLYEHQWSKPMQFTAFQLRKLSPKPLSVLHEMRKILTFTTTDGQSNPSQTVTA